MEVKTPKKRIVSKEQPLFKNKVIETLSRTHISVPISLFAVYSGAVMYYGITEGLLSAGITALAFVIGLLFFTWIEYNIHRFVFHMITNTKFKESVQYHFHGVHHDYPQDKSRLAMPPVVSMILSTLVFLFFRLIMGDYAFGFFPGFIMGYAAYLFVHYIVHAWRAPNNVFRILWINHGIHHHKRDDRAYGVSSPLWDYIYRTMP